MIDVSAIRAAIFDWFYEAASLLKFQQLDITKLDSFLYFNWSRRAGMYRLLSSKVANEIPIEDALQKYVDQQRKRKKKATSRIGEAIRLRYMNGESLASAMSDYTQKSEGLILYSGERSGELPVVLDRMMEARDNIADLLASMFMSIIPSIIYSVAVFMLLMSIGQTVNSESPSSENGVGFSATVVLIIAHLTSNKLAILIPISMVGAVILLFYSFPKWTGQARKVADRYYPFSFYRDMQGFMWSMTFISLLTAGLADQDIIDEQIEFATPWLKERLMAISELMHNGESFSNALIKTGYEFPNPDLIDDIDAMSEQSDFSNRFNKRMERWVKEVNKSASRRAFFIALGFEVVMYVVIIIVSVGINGLSQGMGNNF